MLEHGDEIEVVPGVVDQLDARDAFGLECLAARDVEVVEHERRREREQRCEVGCTDRGGPERSRTCEPRPVGPVGHEDLGDDDRHGGAGCIGCVGAEFGHRDEELVEVRPCDVLGAELSGEAQYLCLDGGGRVLEREWELDGVGAGGLDEAGREALELRIDHEVGVGGGGEIGWLRVIVRRVQDRGGSDHLDVGGSGELGQCARPCRRGDHVNRLGRGRGTCRVRCGSDRVGGRRILGVAPARCGEESEAEHCGREPVQGRGFQWMDPFVAGWSPERRGR